MRKDTLRYLIEDWQQKLGQVNYYLDFINFYLLNESSLLRLLKEFLYSEEIFNLSDHEDIKFSQFEIFLTARCSNLLSNYKYFPINSTEYNLLYQFKHAAIFKPSRAGFFAYPGDIKNSVISYMDLKTFLLFSRMSKSHTELNIDPEIDWFGKLNAAGCSSHLLAELAKTKVVKNYKILYRAYTRQPTHDCAKIDNLWQLFCLSGDPSAISYAISQRLMTHHTVDRSGRTPLHYAALSGVPAQLDKLLSLDVDVWYVDHYGRDIRHFAAASGVPAQLTKVASMGMNIACRDNNGRHILHYAAWSGVPDQFDKAIMLGLNCLDVDNNNRDAAHYAGRSGSTNQIEKVCSYGLSAGRVDKDGRDAYWYQRNCKTLVRAVSYPVVLPSEEKVQDSLKIS